MTQRAHYLWEGDQFFDVWCQGRHWRVIKPKAQTQVTHAHTPSAGLEAPLPGKVQKVFVKAGDKVKAGAVLLVMEAMKMEYKITAPQAGVVKKLPFKVGDQVAMGEMLVILE